MSDELKEAWGAGSIYAIAHEMNERGVTLSALNGHRVHYCVTSRSAGDRNFVNKFAEALAQSLDATRAVAAKVCLEFWV